jgi:hypothetical protein
MARGKKCRNAGKSTKENNKKNHNKGATIYKKYTMKKQKAQGEKTREGRKKHFTKEIYICETKLTLYHFAKESAICKV